MARHAWRDLGNSKEVQVTLVGDSTHRDEALTVTYVPSNAPLTMPRPSAYQYVRGQNDPQGGFKYRAYGDKSLNLLSKVLEPDEKIQHFYGGDHTNYVILNDLGDAFKGLSTLDLSRSQLSPAEVAKIKGKLKPSSVLVLPGPRTISTGAVQVWDDIVAVPIVTFENSFPGTAASLSTATSMPAPSLKALWIGATYCTIKAAGDWLAYTGYPAIGSAIDQARGRFGYQPWFNSAPMPATTIASSATASPKASSAPKASSKASSARPTAATRSSSSATGAGAGASASKAKAKKASAKAKTKKGSPKTPPARRPSTITAAEGGKGEES